MVKIYSIIGLFCFIYLTNGLTSNSFISHLDKEKFKNLLDNGFKKNSKDIKTCSLVLTGYSLLERKFEKLNEVCEVLKSATSEAQTLDEIYYISSALDQMNSGDCKVDNEVIKNKLPKLDEVKTMEELYKMVFVMKQLGLKPDVSIDKMISTLSKKEGGVAMTQAYSYKIAVALWSDKKEILEKYFKEIEDTIQQADEADNLYLYFENRLEGTAVIVNSLIHLSTAYGKVPPVDSTKMVKFANFLLSRRHALKLSTSVEIMRALKSLARNKFSVPMALVAKNNAVINPHSSNEDLKKLQVNLYNVWGDVLPNLKLKVKSAKSTKDNKEESSMANKELEAGSQPGSYLLDMKLNRGFYAVRLVIQSSNTDTRFEASTEASLIVKVNTEVSVELPKLAIKEKNHLDIGTLNYNLKVGFMLDEILTVNAHHKLELTFSVHDRYASESSGKPMRPHQVFMKLTHKEQGHEIIYVIDFIQSDNIYKYTLDLEKSAKDFDNLSGKYDLTLLVGDFLIGSSVEWKVVTVSLEMTGEPKGVAPASAESRRSVAGSKRASPSHVSPRIGVKPSAAKPEIRHMFRPAEKRGGKFISTVFTALCTIIPFGIMVILWLVLGINVANLPMSVSALLFHSGLGAIFALYYCYWKYLNMFTTMRYLMMLGVVTAFFGNRVLRHIAAKHNASA